MFAQPCEYIKNQFILSFNWVNCMMCALYLNQVVWFLKKEAARLEGTNTALAADVYICVAIRKPRLDPISALATSPAPSLKPIFWRSSVSCIKTSAQTITGSPLPEGFFVSTPPFQLESFVPSCLIASPSAKPSRAFLFPHTLSQLGLASS